MLNKQSNAGLCYFVSRANSLIHETTKIYYRFRSEFPVDGSLLQKSSILSAAFYLKRKAKEPTMDVAFDLGMDQDDFQKIIYYFDRFSDDPSGCFYDYANEVEKLIEESALSKGVRGYILVPQFSGKQQELESYLTPSIGC